jgi:hypothetical protein
MILSIPCCVACIFISTNMKTICGVFCIGCASKIGYLRFIPQKTQLVLPLCSCMKVKGRRKDIRLQFFNKIVSLFQDLDYGITFSPCASTQAAVTRGIRIVSTYYHFFHCCNYDSMVIILVEV